MATIADQINDILTKVDTIAAPAPVDLSPVLSAIAGIKDEVDAIKATLTPTPAPEPAPAHD